MAQVTPKDAKVQEVARQVSAMLQSNGVTNREALTVFLTMMIAASKQIGLPQDTVVEIVVNTWQDIEAKSDI